MLQNDVCFAHFLPLVRGSLAIIFVGSEGRICAGLWGTQAAAGLCRRAGRLAAYQLAQGAHARLALGTPASPTRFQGLGSPLTQHRGRGCCFFAGMLAGWLFVGVHMARTYRRKPYQVSGFGLSSNSARRTWLLLCRHAGGLAVCRRAHGADARRDPGHGGQLHPSHRGPRHRPHHRHLLVLHRLHLWCAWRAHNLPYPTLKALRASSHPLHPPHPFKRGRWARRCRRQRPAVDGLQYGLHY